MSGHPVLMVEACAAAGLALGVGILYLGLVYGGDTIVAF